MGLREAPDRLPVFLAGFGGAYLRAVWPVRKAAAVTPSIPTIFRHLLAGLALAASLTVPGAAPASAAPDQASPITSLPACDGPIEINNRSYATVEIGPQCWMAQNLDVALPGSSCFGAREANCAVYGRLYGQRQIPDLDTHCPSGWRVATDEDWQLLEMTLGMPAETAASSGWRRDGAVENQLATFISGGTNASGFTAFAGGMRYYSSYMMQGEAAYFHAAGSNHARAIRTPTAGILRMDGENMSKLQLSARCVRPATG